jgi:hypothetical protein
MATLEKLKEQKRELEDRLADGDLSAEPALARIDRAIASRTLKVQHSRKRLDAVKHAVAAGMDPDDARRRNNKAIAKKLAEARKKRPLNRF